MVEQVHIYKKENMIPYAVPAVEVNVERAEHPNLYNGKRAENISRKRAGCNKAVLNVMQQRVISADYINKNKVVYQLKILNLFLLFSKKRHYTTRIIITIYL